jgi:hypothetical protein
MIATRTLGAWAGVTAATLAVVVGVQAQSSTATPAHKGTKGLPACRYEDGSTQRACYWDGRTMGNRKGDSYVIMNGEQTIIVRAKIKVPASCRALANVGSWKSWGEDGPMVWNGAELSRFMIEDSVTFKWGTKGLDRACTAWLDEFARDHLKILNKR